MNKYAHCDKCDKRQTADAIGYHHQGCGGTFVAIERAKRDTVPAAAPCDGSAPVGKANAVLVSSSDGLVPVDAACVAPPELESFEHKVRAILAKNYGVSALDWSAWYLLACLDTMTAPNDREARLLAAHRAIEGKLVDMQNRLDSADGVIQVQADRIRLLARETKRLGAHRR